MLPTDKNALADLIRQVVMETINVANCPVKKIPVPCLDVTEEHRMDTGNPADKVWTRDLFTLEEAPRLGCGLMVMEETTFPWTLNYDEMDYIIEGRLDIIINGQTVSAGPGEVIHIP
ncbi:MAG: ethanolamine utilization protein EutQ, partial [Clostridia bacterium]|nr:ethanolamine utilization protein EutQ [Clostridia bacterium]